MPTKIALVAPPVRSHRTAEETIALGYLGVLLQQAGFDVCVVDGWLERLTAEQIVTRLSEGGSPLCVGMSCYRSNLEESIEVLWAVKNRIGSIPVICGGYGPTFNDALFLAMGFDVVVRGDAESIIVPLIHALLGRGDLEGVPGVTFQKKGEILRTIDIEPLTELDRIPFPLRATIKQTMSQGNFVHLCTSRGCSGHCVYCSIFSFASIGATESRWRGRSIVNIVNEVEYLYREYGARYFKFVDDSFIDGPRDWQWAEAFRDELKRRGLPIRFRTQVRADRLSRELVYALKQAGWFSTSLGVENASDSALKRMGKIASRAKNEAALEMLAENQIYVQMGLILFGPDTTMDELFENLAFLKGQNWPVNKGIFTEMFAAEGTLFTKGLQEKGLLISKESGNNEYKIFDPSARRVYAMLKHWHASHSRIYDWVIDSLTAPKVLPDEGYAQVHVLCRKLHLLDLLLFEQSLGRISSGQKEQGDHEFTKEAISRAAPAHAAIKQEIGKIYLRYGLMYDGIPNPFLTEA